LNTLGSFVFELGYAADKQKNKQTDVEGVGNNVFEITVDCVVKGLKGEKGDLGRGSVAGISGMDTSGFPAGFVEGPQGPPGRKVSIAFNYGQHANARAG